MAGVAVVEATTMDIKVIELDREDMATHLKDMDTRRILPQAQDTQSQADEPI